MLGRKKTIVLLFVLILGFGLRMLQPDLVEFKRDEATITRLGQAIAYESYLPAVGVDSSLGIDNLPLTLYISAVAVRIWNDPLAVVILTCLLNSLALVACYLLTRSMFGEKAALLATLLFAVCPWAVLYARKIWARTLPLATLGYITALYFTFVKRRKWMMVAAFAMLAVLLGLQLEALAYVPILGLLILVYRKDIEWRPLLAGALVFLLLMAPYIIYDVSHDWENTRGLLDYAGGDGQWSLDAVRYSLNLLGSEEIDGQAGPYHLQFRGDLEPFWWLNTVLNVVFVTSVIFAAAQAIRQRKTGTGRSYLIMLLWLALPVALQLKPSSATQQHYYVMHYPAQFMIMGHLITQAYTWLKEKLATRDAVYRGLLISGSALLALICVWQLGVTVNLRRYMVEYPGSGGYGLPLRFTRQAVHLAIEAADGSEIIVLDEGTQPHVTETPTVYDALLFGTLHRFVDGRHALLIPGKESKIYIIPPAMSSYENQAYRQPVIEEGMEYLTGVAIVDEFEIGIYRLDQETTQTLNQTMIPLLRGIPFEDNVVFTSYDAPASAQAGETMTVWLTWWVQGIRPEAVDTHFTVQLLDANGTLISQDDQAAFPSSQWQVDDQVLSRFELDIPAGAKGMYTLRAGMYTYPGIESIAVVDYTGQRVDNGVTLSSITIN